ncbi:fumarate/nitrate reduction transcriptional regulator Fnr [Brackiella oedipodis]|uniref:fumarate/nitrate reduction transcriptional regulator Fnr n=1 Tax=Brackiella oedipodis TaxID=124225 RepID=UPI00048C5B4E|nr:fumarate/nitrate reduction transcriptional regulator Fnr [Brackiella oedipodis]
MLKRVILDNTSFHCSNCMIGHLCMAETITANDINNIDTLIKERIRVNKGSLLFKSNDPLKSIYSIRSGTFKTQLENENGQMQITGFFLPGELIGLDGFANDYHKSNAIALEDSEVCVIRLADLDRLALHDSAVQSQFRKFLSMEISRSHHLILSLGSLRSEQRVASFLINLSQRFAKLGYSHSEFNLRMSRSDIGNYLGLTLETVSRLLSRFAHDGIIAIHQREVKILDHDALAKLLHSD